MPDPIVFGNIIAGVNYTIPPNMLPPYYMADSRNILPVLNGYGSPRGGSTHLNHTPYGTLITSFHELVLNGTSYKFAAKGTVVGKFDGTDFVDHMTGLTTNTYGQWINYGGYAIYANGANNVKKTNGVTVSDLTAHLSGLPAGNCLAEWGERVWTSIGNTLYGSALRAPTDFNTATASIGYWTGTIGDSTSITGITPFFDILLIGKQNQIYQISGTPSTDSATFRLDPLFSKSEKDSVGFSAKNAIVQVGNDLLFLDGYVIKALSGIQAYGDVESISIVGNIKDYLRDEAGIDTTYLSRSYFFHYKHREQIYCSIPTGEDTRLWFVIDYSNQDLRKAAELPRYSFFPMYGLTPICFGGVVNGSRIDIYAGMNDGYVCKLDTGMSDTGVAIEAYQSWCIGDKIRNIQPVSLGTTVRSATGVTLSFYYALGLQEYQEIRDSTNWTLISTDDVSDGSWIQNKNVYYKIFSSFMTESGQSVAFKVYHNFVNEDYEVRDSVLRFRLQRRYILD